MSTDHTPLSVDCSCVKPMQTVLEGLRARGLLELVVKIGTRRGVSLHDLCGRTRTRSVSWARQEVWWHLRHHPERYYSLLEIAHLFGRDHTTVSAGVAAHQHRVDSAAVTSNDEHANE